jgi:hypothetical protein
MITPGLNRFMVLGINPSGSANAVATGKLQTTIIGTARQEDPGGLPSPTLPWMSRLISEDRQKHLYWSASDYQTTSSL